MEVKMEQKKDTKKKRLVGLEKRKARAGYLFCMPFILGFLLFMENQFRCWWHGGTGLGLDAHANVPAMG